MLIILLKKKYLLILIILSLFCLIASVSAEKYDLADNSNSHITNDSDSELSLSIAKDTKQSADNSSSVSNPNTAEKSKTSDSAVKKTPQVWINKMTVKSDKLVIKLKADKKGTIYYTVNGKNPTVNSKKYTESITLP